MNKAAVYAAALLHTVINETKTASNVTSNYATNIIGVTGIEARKQSGTTGFFIKDLHGDVLYAATASGIPFANYLYDAWGNETTADASAWEKDNPVRYNGQYYDAETGMYYLRARYYDPQMSRFISEDPIKDGLNWYAYCAGDPVNFVDLNGLEDKPVREMVEALGGTVHWNDENKSFTVDFGSAGKKTYYVGKEPPSTISYVNAIPYLKSNEDGTSSAYMNEDVLYKDFGIVDSQSAYCKEINASITFTLFKKDGKYKQRFAINGSELDYIQVDHKSYTVYSPAMVIGRPYIGVQKIPERDVSRINQFWKEGVNDALTVLENDPMLGGTINNAATVISYFVPELSSTPIVNYSNYKISFMNRYYYIDPETKNIVYKE